MADKTHEARSWYTRRGFLKVASLGIAAAAVLAWSLKGIPGGGRVTAASSEFPGEDSIFHPRRDPREVAKEKMGRQA